MNYNLTIDDIKEMSGGARSAQARKRRRAFALKVAQNETFDGVPSFRKRLVELIGCAPGQEDLQKILTSVKKGSTPTKNVVYNKQIDLQRTVERLEAVADVLDNFMKSLYEDEQDDTQTQQPPTTDQTSGQ